MHSGERLREGLRRATASAALPYGFTLAIWTSGAVVSHERGIPSALYAFLFMFGAVTAFVLVSLVAYGDINAELTAAPAASRLRLWQGFHVFAVGLSIAAAGLVAGLVENGLAWPLAGFSVVAVFLLVAGIMRALEPDGTPGGPEEGDTPPPA